MALAEASKTASWLITLLADLHFEIQRPIRLHCDNIGSITMAINPRINPCTRHIATHYHFTREKIASGDLELEYVPSLEQLADIFTKPLGWSLFEKLRNTLNMVDIDSLVRKS